MQNQGDFKLCASLTDVVENFAVIKSVVIKRVHCMSKPYLIPCNRKVRSTSSRNSSSQALRFSKPSFFFHMCGALTLVNTTRQYTLVNVSAFRECTALIAIVVLTNSCVTVLPFDVADCVALLLVPLFSSPESLGALVELIV